MEESSPHGREPDSTELPADTSARPPAAPAANLPESTDSPEDSAHQEELLPAAIALRQSFVGPLPPPKLLSEYEQVLPGLAERIVTMAEAEGDHRRSVEQRLIRLSEGGLVSAFVLALVAIVGGLLLLWEGKTLGGLT